MINVRRFTIRQLYSNPVKTWLQVCFMLPAEIKLTQLAQLSNFFAITDKEGYGPLLPLRVFTSQNIRNSP